MDIEELSLEQIMAHPQFYSITNLELDNSDNYYFNKFWLVIFKANERNEKGIWVLFGEVKPFELTAFFKLKKP